MMPEIILHLQHSEASMYRFKCLPEILLILTVYTGLVISAGCNKNDDPFDHRSDITGFAHYDTLGQIVLGAPTNTSIALKLLFQKNCICSVLYSDDSSSLKNSTSVQNCESEVPAEILISGLQPDTRYYYCLNYKNENSSTTVKSPVYSFITCRRPGSTFSFGVQGDSHPERVGKMFDADLYKNNMRNVAANGVDFYFTMGDDFSIERLIESGSVSQQSVNNVYASQREYIGIAGSNASVFMVNGNHEQAALYLIDSTDSNPAVFAGNARRNYYPLPFPDQFYSGNTIPVDHIGLLGNYYSFTWGDALFVVIDPYWHTTVKIGGGEKRAEGGKGNLWDVTLGKIQYDWLRNTLENSNSKYKFVFEHHILGTGRGGIEMADQCEWGGYGSSGDWGFESFRPGWEEPIHQLFVRTKVTAFFQGHDHLFCKQELDGVIYQSVPNPADPTYTAFNASSYTSGITLPNSGFLYVTVSPENVKVDYISAVLPGDETTDHKNAKVCYSYEITK